jgi:hypothetical protein
MNRNILNGLIGAILLLILFTGCSKESEVIVTQTTKVVDKSLFKAVKMFVWTGNMWS